MKKKNFLKTLGFTFLFILMICQVNAQPVKGNLIAEYDIGDISIGNSEYTYYSNDTAYYFSDAKSFNFYMYPTIGYFISDKLAIGTQLNIYYYKNTSNSYNGDHVKTYDYISSNTSLGLIPFARYYFAGNEKTKYYAQIGGGVRFDLSTDGESTYYDALGNVTGTSFSDYTQKYGSFSGTILAGWNRYITQSLALNMNVGYTYSKSGSAYKSVSTTGGVTTISDEYKSEYKGGRITWTIGFTMCFPHKKS